MSYLLSASKETSKVEVKKTIWIRTLDTEEQVKQKVEDARQAAQATTNRAFEETGEEWEIKDGEQWAYKINYNHRINSDSKKGGEYFIFFTTTATRTVKEKTQEQHFEEQEIFFITKVLILEEVANLLDVKEETINDDDIEEAVHVYLDETYNAKILSLYYEYDEKRKILKIEALLQET